MNRWKILVFSAVICSGLCAGTVARGALAEEADHPQVWRDDEDGVLEADEYRRISPDGAITRRPCPYTCEMRGIERSHCKEWRSKNGSECYVHDTRFPNHVMPDGIDDQKK